VSEKTTQALAEVLGLEAEEITSSSTLVGDLEATSLDVVDLIFQLKRTFGIEISLADAQRELGGEGVTEKFPSGKTAFLVIHGIGEQNPFETLDSFARGLINHLRSEDIGLEARHQIIERKGASGSGWIENYVRLASAEGKDIIDIHEYYWAYLSEEKITLSEIWDWVEKALQATKNFYRENEDLVQRYERDGKARFRLERVAWNLYLLRMAHPFIKLAIAILSLFRTGRLSIIDKLIEGLNKYLRPILIGYIGDTAIYTTINEKSRFFRLRQQILAESQALLESILDNDYDRVIIAGHSLGSVIAYDTLNRLNIRANLPIGAKLPIEKLKGLITFGSPLDKIAFFFREHTKKDQWIRRKIIEHLHSFKAKPFNFDTAPNILTNSIGRKLDDIPWVNYHNELDPISGHLDFYQIPDEDNIKIELPGP
jgi:acyl carrier protein